MLSFIFCKIKLNNEFCDQDFSFSENLRKDIMDLLRRPSVTNYNKKRLVYCKTSIENPNINNYSYLSKPNLKENASLSRSVATEGMVLLKNENILPIFTSKKLLLLELVKFLLLKAVRAVVMFTPVKLQVILMD